MSNVNRVFLMGHIANEPNFRILDDGREILTFQLATVDEHYKKGTQLEHTELHNVVMWRGMAKFAIQTLKKNSLVYIEGKLHTKGFFDGDIKRYNTEIIAEQFRLL